MRWRALHADASGDGQPSGRSCSRERRSPWQSGTVLGFEKGSGMDEVLPVPWRPPSSTSHDRFRIQSSEAIASEGEQEMRRELGHRLPVNMAMPVRLNGFFL